MKTMMRVCGIALTILASANTFAGQYEIDQIERAAGKLDMSELKTIAAQVQGYDQELAYYRLALSSNLSGESDPAIKWNDKAISLLEALEEAQPNDAEIKALLAQVYGYKIALQPIKGMFYGSKSNAMLAGAEALSPNNPRAHLVKGIAKLNTPAIFGGSLSEATEAFNKAILAYEFDVNSNYHWGFAEAYTWRGLVKMQSGELAQAKEDWQLALNINPDYGWAKTLLSQN
jgi:tetratricopeptide (TPR) repeat protein